MNRPDRMLLAPEDIQARIRTLAAEIDRDYAGRDPVLLTLLKGSFYFSADLTRALSIDHTIDFMAVALNPDRLLEVRISPLTPLSGRSVLILEDIIDSGLTLHYVVNHLKEAGAASVEICTLLDNPTRRLVDLPIRYLGFTIPDVFVVGYGLDVGERYRTLPAIYEYEEDA